MTDFLWYDYETFGANPQQDRPAQFAAIRTDANLNPIADPIVIYCRPANDFLPSIDACLITGITPQEALEKGLPERDFFKLIRDEMKKPNTCSVGYNSIAFDSEVTRHGLYRNFTDAYEHEWRNNTSRWDLLDVIRTAYALRPGSLVWPKNPDDSPSFKLGALTQSNGIEHVGAHDALVDVRATIALARLVKEREPNFFNYMLKIKDKHEVSSLLKIGQPVVHVSKTVSASKGCLAVEVPLVKLLTNKNAVIMFNLDQNPEVLINASVDELKRLVFSKKDDLNEGEQRVGLSSLQINKCPAVMPRTYLTEKNAQRLGIGVALHDKHLEQLTESLSSRDFQQKIMAVFDSDYSADQDVDLMLYSGGFFCDQDKQQFSKLLSLTPEQLSSFNPRFTDKRCDTMLFRFRARNHLDTLSRGELDAWDDYRWHTINQDQIGYTERLTQLLSNDDTCARDKSILTALVAWREFLDKPSSLNVQNQDEPDLSAV